MRNALTRMGWSGMVVSLLATACVGRSAEAGDTTRLAALEARVAELEGRVASPASPATPDDAGTEVLQAGDAAPVGELDMPEAGLLDRTPEEVESACLEQSPRNCEHEARRKRLSAPPTQGTREWVEDKPIPAESTAEGRACLARHKTACREQGKSHRRYLALFSWLDGQLTPERIDHAFTAAVVERARRMDNFVGAISCTPQFCRLQGGSSRMSVRHVAALADAGTYSLMSHGGFLYVNRPGYSFPN